MDDLLAEFVAETRETLERTGESLVAWEADPSDTARLDEIFRFVHTVKGSCGFLDLPRIGRLAHEAESVLGSLRGGTRSTDPTLVGAILALIDRIGVLSERLGDGGEAPDPAGDETLISALSSPVQTAVESVPAPFVAARNVRLGVDLLDAMMNQVSDLVLARNELARALRGNDAALLPLERLSNALGDLRDSVTKTRMQPIERLFAALPRLVRDTAAATGKCVVLTVEGGDVEIDREMIEAVRDPLTHIIRNAIDHGIEPAEVRAAAGKSEAGALTVSARQTGNQIAITVSDDGAGIDLERLTERAVRAKRLAASAVATLTPERAAQLVFEPGLSTSKMVTDISGRGVGMDVVRANIERLGGMVVLDNRPGQGLAIALRVPLTLSILSALTVRAGGQQFAIPRAAIEEVVAIDAPALRFEAVGDGHIAVLRGATLPVAALDKALALTPGEPERLVVIHAPGSARFALAVDAVGDHEELVVRPIAPQLAASGVFGGQSLPDDGEPVLLIDPLGLAERLEIRRVAQAVAEVVEPEAAPRSMLSLTGFDGVLRAIRVADTERIEEVAATDFTTIGRQHFVKLGGVLHPVRCSGSPPAKGYAALLRITTPSGPVAHAVAAVHDLVPIGVVTPVEGTDVEGLVLIDGAPAPLIAVTPKRKRAA